MQVSSVVSQLCILVLHTFILLILGCKLLETEPELVDLINLIGEISADWELFGAQLNIQQSAMNVIKVDNPNNCRLCFQHLLSEWKKTSTKLSPVTWQTIIKALDSLREYALAEKVYRHLAAIK